MGWLDRIPELARDLRARGAVGERMHGAATGVLRKLAGRFVGDLPIEGQIQATRAAAGLSGHAQRGGLAGAGVRLDLDGATGTHRLHDTLLFGGRSHAISSCSGRRARTRRRMVSACAREASARRAASPLTLSTI